MTSRPLALTLLLVGCASSPLAERPGPLVDPYHLGGEQRPDRTVPPRGLVVESVDDRALPHDTGPVIDTGYVGTPPDCGILAPASGAELPPRTPIRFTAHVEDDDDDVIRVLWASDVWGAMMVGEDFEFALPAADHVIRLRVDDAAGHRCERTILLHVR